MFIQLKISHLTLIFREEYHIFAYNINSFIHFPGIEIQRHATSEMGKISTYSLDSRLTTVKGGSSFI